MAEQIFCIVNGIEADLMRPRGEETRATFYVCGGYADAIVGAVPIFENALNVKIQPLVCPLTEQNPPDKTSLDAVIISSLFN